MLWGHVFTMEVATLTNRGTALPYCISGCRGFGDTQFTCNVSGISLAVPHRTASISEEAYGQAVTLIYLTRWPLAVRPQARSPASMLERAEATVVNFRLLLNSCLFQKAVCWFQPPSSNHVDSGTAWKSGMQRPGRGSEDYRPGRKPRRQLLAPPKS